MTVAVNTDGSQTATISTEHDLATITAAGFYQLVVDVNAMAGGATPDITELRMYTKARSGGTERLEEMWPLQGVQSKPMFRSIPIPVAIHVRFTLKQTQGTGRAYPWAVYGW